MAKKNEAQVITETTETTSVATEQTNKRDMNALATKHQSVKSKMIRELAAEGLKTSEITKLMQTLYPKFIYQHARNVLNQKTKKES